MLKRLLSLAPLCLLAFCQGALADDWPTRTIRFIVPFSAGGAVDVLARLVAEPLSDVLGQPIVVENKTGAGGTIGAAAVAKAEPDGYTVLVHSSSHTVSPALMSSLPYDAQRDLAAVIPLASQPIGLMVSPTKGYESVRDLVETGKKGSMNYGSGGIGNATHLIAERFQLSAGFKATHIPYKGSPQAIRAVVAERIDFSFSTVLPALALVREGRLKILAVTGQQRASALPDIPTTIEAGYPNSDYTFWIGMLVPHGTSQSIIDRLHRETATILQSSKVKERLAKLGADPMPMTSAEFTKMIAKEIATNKGIVKAAGIPVN